MRTVFLRLTILLILAVVLSPIFGQTAPPTPQRTVWDVLKDPENITFLTFIGSNMADAKTDWRFVGPFTHKQYVITPLQRLTITLGTSAAVLYLREQFPDKPRFRRAITIGMGIATAYFTGRALANTYNHGSPGSPPAAAGTNLSFAVRIR
jgi:hypothetical protein